MSVMPSSGETGGMLKDRSATSSRRVSNDDVIKLYKRSGSYLQDETFANKMILKYNILTLKKQRIVEQIQNHPEMGERYLSYLSNIDLQVQEIQQYAPEQLAGHDSKGLRNGQGPSLQIFMSTFDHFVDMERQSLESQVSADDLVHNLMLRQNVNQNIQQLELICSQFKELCKEVQSFYDKIKEFAAK